MFVLRFPTPRFVFKMNVDEGDRVVRIVPVHFSNNLNPNIHLHQYPLLNRPLQVPPSASASGTRIKARIKPGVRKLELHVPVDTRPEVWNAERSKELGGARDTDDKERNQEAVGKGKQREAEDHRLSEFRMRGEPVSHSGAYVLGIVRDGKNILVLSSKSFVNSILRYIASSPNKRNLSVTTNAHIHRCPDSKGQTVERRCGL